MAQFEMPDMKQMSGIPRPVTDLPDRWFDLGSFGLDDRDERPGVKFKDSELIGFPFRIGIGEKSLTKGVVELKPRAGALITTQPDQVVTDILELIRS